MKSTYKNIIFGTRITKAAALLLLLFFCLELSAQRARESKKKAEFLFNFAQFIDWPATSFSAADAPFVIGVLGEDRLGSSLDGVVEDETVKGHPVVVERYENAKDVKNCQVLFIALKESNQLKDVLSVLPAKGVLTVSDMPEFAASGGMIQFVTKENKIKLQINLSAAKSADLNISSKLLQVAEIVR